MRTEIIKSVTFRIQTIKKTKEQLRCIALCISVSFGDGLALENIDSTEPLFLQISVEPRENLPYYDYKEIKEAAAYTECPLTGATLCSMARARQHHELTHLYTGHRMINGVTKLKIISTLQ